MSENKKYDLLNDFENQILLELTELIQSKSIKKIRDFLDQYTLADIAYATESLDPSSQLFLLRSLKTVDAAELFSYLDENIQFKLVNNLTEEWGMKLLQELQTDELADILEDLPANLTRKILNNTDPQKREKINSILSYNDNQVGSIMSVDISTVTNTLTCKKALAKIRRDYKNKVELSHHLYVVDQRGVLLGSVMLEEIVFSDEEEIIDEIYSPVRSVHTYDSKEEASLIFADQDQSALPVINRENYLIGMITSDDVIDVIQEAATEDIYKMSGINPDAAEESYLKTTVWTIVKSRILWLLILMLSATISQLVIEKFTNISESFLTETLHITIPAAIIVALIPVISGSAGNAGSQSSTTITRATALGELEFRDAGKAILKEVRVAIIVGVLMFIFNILRLFLYFVIFRTAGVPWSALAFVILGSSFSLFAVVIIAKMLGTVIPIIAVKFKKDPAVMSAPILATLSDAISTLIFFGINIGMLTLGVALGIIPTNPIVN
ncbi:MULTISPECIES: magnesium transporter [unclassified Mycoplasma]|uniref:magnesium transporter n=1 Tax=unclassified Mycoplasma TaxID=2683645 RepID=UPI00211BBC02|nr:MULTISPECIES: magnesium transporter [unclassified Mycoplasma]UUM19705.1 magnesium transporter [Mycoplasma sp. 1578d]UUM24688.1 magnesium transporter [Mycoplasma sp. 3686d]